MQKVAKIGNLLMKRLVWSRELGSVVDYKEALADASEAIELV